MAFAFSVTRPPSQGTRFVLGIIWTTEVCFVTVMVSEKQIPFWHAEALIVVGICTVGGVNTRRRITMAVSIWKPEGGLPASADVTVIWLRESCVNAKLE